MDQDQQSSRRTPWSERDDDILLGMRDGGRTFFKIGQCLGRSERSCETRFEHLDAHRSWRTVIDEEDASARHLASTAPSLRRELLKDTL